MWGRRRRERGGGEKGEERGELPVDTELLLSECPLNKYVTITQVPDRNAEMLTWLEQNEIVLGKERRFVYFVDNIKAY